MQRALFVGRPEHLCLYALLEACHEGHEVALFAGTFEVDGGLPDSIQILHGDRAVREDLDAAITRFGPDVVLDFDCLDPSHAGLIADIVTRGGSYYVFVSTADVYGAPLSCIPIPESRGAAGDLTSRAARDKHACEQLLLSLREKAGFPVTIVRAAYAFDRAAILPFFSGGDSSAEAGRRMIARLRNGRALIVPGDGTTLLHVSSARNTGRMIAQFIGQDWSIGQEFTCAHEYAVTADDYIQLFGRALGIIPVIVHVPMECMPPHVTGYNGGDLLSKFRGGSTYFSVERFKRAFPHFSWEVTLDEAAREYVAWNEERGYFDNISLDTVEDDLAQVWRGAVKIMRRSMWA